MLVHLPLLVVGPAVLFSIFGCGGRTGDGSLSGQAAQPPPPVHLSSPAAANEERPVSRPATAPALARYEFRKIYMWIPVRLVLYAGSQEQAEAAARAAYNRVGEIDERMTDYRPTSELMQLIRKAGQGPVKVSDELFMILSRAQEMSRATEGAFDITVGPLVRLWREARKTGKLPDSAAVREAQQRVGWRKIELNPENRTVELTAPRMMLDLGGIAKGYAGDEAIRVMKEHGVDRALFEAGGDIVVGDAPPGAKGWGIEVSGQQTATGEPLVIFISNAAISTSGDTEQFVEIDGKRYSHIVDARTGMGLTNRTQVNVLAPNGLTSDPWATAFSVMGLKRAREIAKERKDLTVWIRESVE